MSEREVFLAALEIRDPDERAAYLDQVCAGDTTLRARVDALLRSHESAGSFLEEPAALDAEETVGQRSNAATAQDEPGARRGPSPEPTLPDSEATGAHVPAPVANDPTVEHRPTPGPTDPDATIDGTGGPQSLPRGDTVHYFGDYEILKELGRGGMGVVYKARQVTLNRPVALKMIKAGMLADSDELRRFQNEAEAVALLDHPGIVPVYEVGEHDGQRYFSMKLIEGGNLAAHLASFQDKPRAAVALLIEAADAIQHAHMRGILHRDLKPANILLDTQGHPHITDFGLAKLMESDVELTASGAIMGTPAYMSPEQAAGRRGEMSLATDVYGLGAILYALLTGRAPFGGDSVIETLDAVRTRPPESPTKRNARVPRDLELICLKCLEKNPADRYPTAAAMTDDLRRWSAGEPVSVRAAGPVERLAKWARRKPTLAAAYTLGLLAVLLGGLGGAAVWQWRAAARARDVAARARDGEAAARATAEKARDGEATARAVAEKARDGEATAREALARVEYGLSMESALQEWRENRLSSALTLLDKARDDFRGWEWHYVHRLSHSDLFTLKGHESNVNSASFSPDGSRIVTASTDKTAKVWDARTGAELLTLKGHTGRVSLASFTSDGSQVVTSSADGTVKVWDAKSGAELRTLKGMNKLAASFSGRVPNPFANAVLQTAPLLSMDGSRSITHEYQGTATVWDTKTDAELLTIKGDTLRGSIFSFMGASFSQDGSRIATANNSTATVWDAKTGAELLTFRGHKDGLIVQSVSFSPDGSRVVTASHDGTAKVWDSRTGAELLTLKQKHFVFSASFSPDGSRIVTGCNDNKVTVWDAQTGAEIRTLKGHTMPVMSASFNADGSRIVSASWDGTAKVWDAKTDFEVLALTGHTDPSYLAASFSHDGSRVVTCSADKTAKVWDASSGTEILTIKGHTAAVFSASFSPDDARVVTGSEDKTAKVWDATTGAELLTLKGHTQPVKSASFSPDGSRVVTASWDRTTKIWDAQTGAVILTLKGHTAAVFSASYSPDGLRVVTGSEDKTSRVWDALTGVELLALKGHNSRVTSAAFSADGSRVVTGCLDKTAKIWNATTGAEIRAFEGRTPYDVSQHAESEGSASFSPDGSRVVTASGDGSAKVWDAETGAELFTLRAWEGGYASSVFFSTDGSRIATVGDITVWVWDATPINRQEILAHRFPAILKGEEQPADNADRLAFAQMAYDVKHFTAAARLWGEALASDPKPDIDGSNQNRWRSARAAALAAAGLGQDEPLLDDSAKAKLRAQALDSLKAELAALQNLLESDPPRAQPAIVHTLSRWQQDADLAVIRDAAALAKLPEEEQKAINRFWADVAAALEPFLVKVKILKAEYGSGVHQKDVTELLQRLASQLRAYQPLITLPSPNYNESFGGDPARDVVKQLKIQYTLNGKPGEVSFPENAPILLPTPTLPMRFAAVLRGEDKPADNSERLAFAQIAYDQKQFALAARLWAEALASDPKLGDDPQAQHRYNAARAAALAAAGEGQDEPPLDDSAKAKLRGQVLDWLKAELTVWTKLLESGRPEDQPTIRQTLGHWLHATELAGIRDTAALAKLPTEERKEFSHFWAEAAEVLVREVGPFVKRLETLPAAEQVEEVRKELRNRNPDYDGTLTPTIQNDAVIGLQLTLGHLTDIFPVRALTGLKRLEVLGGSRGESLADLAPLRGMSLSVLILNYPRQVADLSPLKGMPLEHLHMWGWTGSDLSPLEGMPLRLLNCGGGGQKLDLTPLAGLPLDFLCINGSQASDLSPLKNAPITQMLCSNTQVSDLAPLRGMHLRVLDAHHTKVSDLSPIRGMPLNELTIEGTLVTDLSPLKDLPLKVLRYEFRGLGDAKILSAIKTLETINGVPPKTFWETEPRKERFPALLRGEDKPADNSERLAFAQIAYEQKQFTLATRLWAEALESDPKIGDDRLAEHRYHAARAAVLAAAGQGEDSAKLDDAAKGKLRGQALDWLKAELAWLGKQLERDRSSERAAVQAELLAWQKDGFLANIRDAAVLAQLPTDEQKACNQLWADVTALLMKVERDANSRAFRLPGVGHPNGWLAMDREGKWLAVATADKVAVFDAATGELVRTLTGHTDRVYAIAFSPDGKFLAGGNCWGTGNVSTVKVWDLTTGAVSADFESGVGGVQGLNFSGDGKRLFGAGLGGVQMWDLTNGRLVRTFKSGQAQASTRGGSGVFNLGLSPDGKRVVCQDTPTTAKVWDIEGDNPPVTLGGLQRDPTYVAYSPDGRLLATGSDAELLLWDASTLKLVKRIETLAGWLVFDPDGRSLLTAQHDWSRPLKDDVVTRWDLATYEGKPLPPLTGRDGWPAYCLSPDGKRLYTQVVDGPDAEGRIRVYDAATGAGVEFPSLQVPAAAAPAPDSR